MKKTPALMSIPNTARLKEIVVNANEDSLNSAIAEHHIAPENIVTVIFQPASHLAVGDYEAKYRVIYRV